MAAKLKWNSEKVLSISAMVMSFITLVIFIYQTNLMRRQNYLSILPYLSITTSNSSVDNKFSLSLENHGVGPAIIESVTIDYKGTSYDLANFEDELMFFLQAKVPQMDSIIGISHSTLDKGMAIPANKTYNILNITDSEKDYLLLTSGLNKLLTEGLNFKIIYKSIQNERWMITNDTQGPKKIN